MKAEVSLPDEEELMTPPREADEAKVSPELAQGRETSAAADSGSREADGESR